MVISSLNYQYFTKGNNSRKKINLESYFTYRLEIAFDNNNLLALFILDFNLVPDRAPFLQPTLH